MMNGIKKYRYFVEIFVTIILFIKLAKSEAIYKKCSVENNTTLKCNVIPKKLPRQYEHVRILDFKTKYENVSLNSSSFADESWAKVQTIEFNDTRGDEFPLTFSRECFQGLRSLKELKIHSSSFELDGEAFVGLPLVHTLDVSQCYRLAFEDICNALKDKGALPGLKNLIISGIGAYRSGTNNINQKGVEYLLPRNITNIDMSRTEINFINFTAVAKTLKTLQNVNLSYSVIGDTWKKGLVPKDLPSLKVMDISHLAFPAKIIPLIPGKYYIADKTYNYSDLSVMSKLSYILNPKIVNVSEIIPDIESVWIYNCTITFDVPIYWKVTHLFARKNNLKYLDVEFVCRVYKLSSIYHLDLSENKMEMIFPLTCLPNLEIINLSKNKMFEMLGKNHILFEKIFASNNKLRVINLSYNQLPRLPKNMFKYNRNIETINLSFNNLEQLNFDLMDLHSLRMINVRSNKIKILDEVSIKILNGVRCVDDRCSVVMTSNPFLCSTCSCKHSIQWLLSSTLVDTEQQELLCVNENEIQVNVDKSITRRIQTLCNRNTVIIVSTVCSIVSLLAVCMIVVVFYRRNRRFRRKRNMETVLARLIGGKEQYEFVAFLSYSSSDEFVKDHVIDPLNENLKLMIGTDRNLICTGDQHLRPGFRVHDEIDVCLDRASVIIFVISDNFCRSSYCRNEFDKAYLQRKPIVLMLLGNVDEDLMMPTLKRLYKRDVRVLWKKENDQFVLTTTWENICSSILEKVPV